MYISTKIYINYNPFEETYEDYEWELVDVPLMKVCEVLAKRFKIETETMYDIVTQFDIDFGDYFDEDLEVQNLAREYYNPEECEQ